jgi:hypothetical protein
MSADDRGLIPVLMRSISGGGHIHVVLAPFGATAGLRTICGLRGRYEEVDGAEQPSCPDCRDRADDDAELPAAARKMWS